MNGVPNTEVTPSSHCRKIREKKNPATFRHKLRLAVVLGNYNDIGFVESITVEIFHMVCSLLLPVSPVARSVDYISIILMSCLVSGI